MAEIEIKIGVGAGCLSGHLVSSPELMLRLSLAKIEAANLLDQEARAILKTAVGPVRSSHVRVATNLASSYSRAAEGQRRNSEQMLRGNPMAIVEARATATTKAARKAKGSFAAFSPAQAEGPSASKFEGFARDPLASLRPSPSTETSKPVNRPPSQGAEAQPDPAQLLRQMSNAELQAARVKLKGQVISHQMAGEPFDHLKPFVTIMKAELAARKEVAGS